MKLTDKQKNIIREVLDRDEGITAEELAEEVQAGGTNHPLYELIFDCHESAAAWRYYVERTRLVIRSYVHVVPKPGTEDGYTQIRQRAMRQLDSWQQKYMGLLGDDFVIDTLRAKLGELLKDQDDVVERGDRPHPDLQ